MVKVVRGHEDEAYLDLRKVSGVKEAYLILGEYQFFVVMQAKSVAALQGLIGRVRSIPDATNICHVLITDRDASKQLAPIDESSLDFEVPVWDARKDPPNSDQLCSPDGGYQFIKFADRKLKGEIDMNIAYYLTALLILSSMALPAS